MQITGILAQIGGLKSMASELGISETQAASGASALLPAVLGGFKKQAQGQANGLEGLGGLLGKLGGGSLLDNVLSPQPTNISQGNNVLGEIFGSKDVSRTVVANAAPQSGLDPSVLKKMLPMVAMLVTGYMARQGAGNQNQATPSAGGLGGALSGMLGGMMGGGNKGSSGGLAGMIDMNGDGNALDDIMRMAGKAMGR
jgi:hypothetical protein